jgi:protease-4
MGFLVSVGILVGVIVGIVAAANEDGGDDGAAKFVYGDKGSSNRLLSIRVEGVILGEKPVHGGGLFSDPNVVYGYEVKKQLLDASRDASIKGVVIELNTPGGTIFGSLAIADGIRMYRETTGKPVIAYIAGLSASGGVYSMVPATKILADHGSLIGSIGVRLGTIPYYDGVMATEGGLLGGGITTRNGISFTTLTAGRSKDVGSPFRPMMDEEKRVFQQGLDNLYTEFVEHVSKSRSIPEATIRDQMGALVFENATAQKYGLIDGTANREESYAELAKLAKLDGQTWRVVRKDEGGSFLGGLLGKGETNPPEANSQGICFPQNMILAYYGEPSALCKR